MTAPRDNTALQRLAALVTQRRAYLGLHKVDILKRTGLTAHTYNKVEKGEPVRAVTYAKIEPALEWAAGSCLEVLNGAAGATVLEKSPVEGIAYSPVSPADLEDDISASVQDAALAVMDNATAADIKKLTRLAVEEFRRRQKAPDSDRN